MFGVERRLTSFKYHVKKLNNKDGFVDLFWPGTLVVAHKSTGQTLSNTGFVDLLPDREAQTVENCLKDKPHVSIVTRDRFSPYANGIAGGLPHTRQVADRWNPLKNREDALQQLLEKDKELAHDICKGSRDIQEARRRALKFRDMRENKQGHLVKDWIREVVASPQPELKRSARGLLSDYEAVENALTLPWSNGQVEGQTGKLKTSKRPVYGRTGFELLGKRMILSTPLYHQN